MLREWCFSIFWLHSYLLPRELRQESGVHLLGPLKYTQKYFFDCKQIVWYILVQQFGIFQYSNLSYTNFQSLIFMHLYVCIYLSQSVSSHLFTCICLSVHTFIHVCIYTVCVCVCVFLDFSIYPDSYEEIFFLPPQNSCKLGYHHGFRSLTNLVRTLTLSKKTTIFVSSKHITKRTQTFSMSQFKGTVNKPCRLYAGGKTSPRGVKES